MKKLWMVCAYVLLASNAAALDWVYSDTLPETMPLQGGTLVPVDVEQVSVDLDGVTRQQYRFHLLKFEGLPTQAQIDAYVAADVDVQRGSHKHPGWLDKLPETKIKDKVAPLIHGKVLKGGLTDAEWAGIRDKYTDWEPGAQVKAGETLKHDEKLYQAEKDHQAEKGKEPPIAPDLYAPEE